MNEREAYIGFSTFHGVGPYRFKLLLDYFGSAKKAWTAPEKVLLEIGLGGKLTSKFVDFRKDFSAQNYEQELLAREIKTITRIDAEFPDSLLQIPDPPIALFVKGELPKEKYPRIGVVGTRKPTPYGRQITEKLTRELVFSGLVIVSGMARGVDGIAHGSCLAVGGKTIAVLGCGVDVIYPPEHKNLYAEIIAKSGAIVSEVPPGHTVLRGLFPSRNRVISGLSLGIVVTEGAEDSGSLITARYGAEQGREVFAVPGPITSYLSVGPTKLIKQGAKIVSRVEDILEEFGINYASQSLIKKPENYNDLSEEEKEVISLMKNGEIHIDEIIRGCGIKSSEIGATLSVLELKGIIKALPNGLYALN